MSQSIEPEEAARWISEKWSFPVDLSDSSKLSMDLLMRLLKAKVLYLLENDMEKLVNLMYRLDVPEAEFHKAMMSGNTHEIASGLSEIVMKRELKRLEFRKKYSS